MTTFDQFMQEIVQGAQAEGPEAVQQLEAFKDYFRKITESYMHPTTINVGREPRTPAEVFKNPPSFSDSDNLQMVLLYAQEIVDKWPTMTIRTISQMTERVETLRQALAALSGK